MKFFRKSRNAKLILAIASLSIIALFFLGYTITNDKNIRKLNPSSVSDN